ncbi:MAG TPA: hypothetical protein VH834_00620 [Solirubrobacteraceae bacterium]
MALSSPPGWSARLRPEAIATIGAIFLGALAFVLVQVARSHGSWEPSEGVYALTARMFLHGGDLYGDLVAAQPPPLFLVGAGLLAIHDGITWLRFAMGLLQLAAALLAALAVWRMTRSATATALAAPVSLLTPWQVHAGGALTPELLAPVLLLAGAVLADRPDRAPVVGALAGVCGFVKVPYLLPAAVLVLCASDRGRAARWAVGVLLVEVVLSAAVFGDGLWRDTMRAQSQSGYRGLSNLAGVWAQGAWTLVWLVVPAACAVVLRARGYRPRLVLTLAALSVAMGATILTTAKNGTGLNVLVPAEALLAPLAVAGAAWGLAVARAGSARVVARLAGAVAALAMVVAVAQGISLLTDPHAGAPFLRPGLSSGWGIELTPGQVDAQVAALRACNPRLAASTSAYVAFIAHRRMPGDQPDGFLPAHAAVLAPVRAKVAADRPLCP